MKPVVSRLKWWMNARFVLLIEIAGYTLSVIVGAGAIYSMFAQIEILAHANGEIHPVFATVSTDKDAVVVDFAVPSGEAVSAGQPVCRVVTEPEARRRLLAQRQLTVVIFSLERDREATSAKALAEAKAALNSLPPVGEPETLPAPAPGIVKQLVNAETTETIWANTPLAAIYDMDTFALEGIVEPNGAVRVAEGQTARMTLPGIPALVVGKVLSKTALPAGVSVVLRFEHVSPQVTEMFRQLLFGGGTTTPIPPVRADIVVGHQSLFVNMFGRKT